MQTGRVIKAYNSFFYVEGADGLVTCRLRGRLKKGENVYPGDLVAWERLPDGSGVVERLLPRTNLLRRPAVANIDQVVLTFAAAQPDIHPLLLNRFLVLAEWSGIPSILICVNKTDICADGAADMLALYEKIGYPVLRVSARQGSGMAALQQRLEGRVTVFAGPSGVGKSSLLNCLDASLALATGEISGKIKRGRHTTRVAQLIPYRGGYIVDTPGFSALDMEALERQRLPACFPEFLPYLGSCRFSPCTHSHEPDCGIKEAAAAGKIAAERYAAYLNILKEIEDRKKEYK